LYYKLSLVYPGTVAHCGCSATFYLLYLPFIKHIVRETQYITHQTA
jgi:hypothetical protein